MKHLLLFLLLLVPTLASAQTRYTTTSLRLRAEPSSTAAVIATMPPGAAVQVRDCTHEGGLWCSVSYSEKSGYAAIRFLTSDSAAAARAAKASPSRSAATAQRRSSGGSRGGYYTGPRGGCYTYTASGRKRYVDRSYCH